jgi:N,N'-diacetylchitobiose transport system substrate-binding protein
MKFGSRRLVGALAVAACVVALSACGSGAESKPGHVTLRFWTNLNVAAQASVIEAQANACAVNMKNVSVEFEAIPFGDMYTKLATSFQADEGPDIMNTNESAVSFAEDAGYLTPVDDIIDAHGRKDFLTRNLATVEKSGKTWAVPDWALHEEIWYRTDLFEKAGLKVPTTWDELLKDAKTLNDPSAGVHGFAVPMDSVQVAAQTMYQFLYANHVYTFDPKTGKYAFDADKKATVQAVQFMLDLYHEASPAASRTWSWNDFRNAFAEGKLAMTPDFGAVVGLIQTNNPDLLDKISAFELPARTAGETSGGTLGAGGYYYMIGKNGKAREAAAKKLVTCMMTPELAAERANTRPVFAIPAMTSAAETATYKNNEVVKRFSKEIAMIRSTKQYHYGMEAGLNPMGGQIESTTFIGDALQSAAAGNISAAEAVDQINTQLKRIASK